MLQTTLRGERPTEIVHGVANRVERSERVIIPIASKPFAVLCEVGHPATTERLGAGFQGMESGTESSQITTLRSLL
jgi:hypothetical protein